MVTIHKLRANQATDLLSDNKLDEREQSGGDVLHQLAAIHQVLVVSAPRLAGREHEHPPLGICHHHVFASVAFLFAGVVPGLPLGAARPLDGTLNAIEHHVFDLGKALLKLLHATNAPLG